MTRDDILDESKEYELEFEVEETAKRLMENGYDENTAYHLAYEEWIK
jgi:hypothetical protein